MLIHIRIYGRVQGVGYRAWARRQAEKLNVSGWVRNRIDGSVEMLAEGNKAELDLLLSLCRKGPIWGRVDKIIPISIPDAPMMEIEMGLFKIQPTV
jgi:acylphosphatase